MPIRFRCPQCSRDLVADDSRAGKRGRCLGCNEKINIPLTSASSLDHASMPLNKTPTTSLRRELLYVAIAAAILLTVVIVIETVMVGHHHFPPSKEGIFSLELVAVSALIGAFFLGEFFKYLPMLLGRQHGEHPGLHVRDVFIVFLVIVVSLVIFGVFIAALDAKLIQSTSEPKPIANSEARHH